MKVVTIGKLNRFWKNGIKPIKEEVDKLNTDIEVSEVEIFGGAYMYRQGKRVEICISTTSQHTLTHAWKTVATGLPKPRHGAFGWANAVNGTAWGRLQINANGTLAVSFNTLTDGTGSTFVGYISYYTQ